MLVEASDVKGENPADERIDATLQSGLYLGRETSLHHRLPADPRCPYGRPGRANTPAVRGAKLGRQKTQIINRRAADHWQAHEPIRGGKSLVALDA